jgi:glycosyltransferase involved in cell wall biosynthesis
MKLKLSFISVCYNHAPFVHDHLEAVYEFILKYNVDLQWIILDDCSQDDSVDKIWEWLQKKSMNQVQFIQHTSNKGVCKTLNEGVKMAVGDYIKILAMDDYIIPGAFHRQLNRFVETGDKIGITCSNLILLYPDKREKVLYDDNYVFTQTPYCDLLQLKPAFIHSPTLIYKAEVFQNTGYFNEGLKQEDYDMLIRICAVYSVFYFDENTVKRRVLEDSLGGMMFKVEQNYTEVLKVLSTRQMNRLSEKIARFIGIFRWVINYQSNTVAGLEGYEMQKLFQYIGRLRIALFRPYQVFMRMNSKLGYKYLVFMRALLLKLNSIVRCAE